MSSMQRASSAVHHILRQNIGTVNGPLNGIVLGLIRLRIIQIRYTAELALCIDDIERAIYGPYVLPEDVVHFATFRTSDNVWGQIGGHIFCYES